MRSISAMSEAAGATRIAIIVGAGIGALGALMAGAPRATSPKPAKVAQRLAETAVRRDESPEPPAPDQAPSGRPPTPTPAAGKPTAVAAAPATPSAGDRELEQLAVTELEKRCAFRKPKACLAGARAFDAGRGTAADAGKARLYRALAVSLLDERCLARDAESCHELAELYRTGVGVDRNPSTAVALGRRVRELCVGRTTAFCERLGTSPVSE